MPVRIPYALLFPVVAAANGQITGAYQVPVNEKLTIQAFLFTATSSSFVVYDIRDSRNIHYTNASLATPLPATHFTKSDTANISIYKLPTDLFIDGGVIFYIDFKDTSGAQNTINWTNLGFKDLP